ncbi:MAG: hypothetical protein M3430_12740 [Acidobacteriota bacterium]|nr:hypothetical protein [Acidobacteriota bacterium]
MKLPNAENAVADIAKLRDYSLNPQHRVGGHKARVFRSALGISVDDAEWLREKILAAVLEAEAADGAPSVFGRKYVVDFNVRRGARIVGVRTSWIVEHGKDFPRLTSCYVKD